MKVRASVKKMCSDCGCVCITPEEKALIFGKDKLKALVVIQKVLGLVK